MKKIMMMLTMVLASNAFAQEAGYKSPACEEKVGKIAVAIYTANATKPLDGVTAYPRLTKEVKDLDGRSFAQWVVNFDHSSPTRVGITPAVLLVSESCNLVEFRPAFGGPNFDK